MVKPRIDVTAEALRRGTLEELERVYREAPAGSEPTGLFRGEALARVRTDFAGSVTARALLLPFERLPFWVDFASHTWAFVDPRVRMGRFRVDPGRSRWRDTDTLRLRYDVSRLPLRGLLYDEVKPLADGLCLGLGGINFERGTGELFFFLLEIAAPRSRAET